MEAFHPPKEIEETIDDSDLPKEEGISEKWLREKIDSLIPLIQERWPNIAQQTLEKAKGSIDDLVYTLNETRIWLYITNQKQWIPSSFLVQKVKNIEDKLSEEIHQSLMQKFVDKNKSQMVQNLNISEKNISISNNTYVMIKEEKIGVISGFKISFDKKFQDILTSNYQKIIKDQMKASLTNQVRHTLLQRQVLIILFKLT